jgi:hypothetical protein
LDFAGGEIRIRHKTRFFSQQRFQTILLQLFHCLGGASVLPDDGVGNGIPRFAIPKDYGFALICYPDGSNIFGRNRSVT